MNKSCGDGYFIITRMHRADFEGMGYDASKLTDADMERIAEKMGESYVENQFWIDLEFWAEEYGLDKIDTEEDEND